MKKIFLLTIFSLFASQFIFAQEITISRGGVDYTNGSIDAWFDVSLYPGPNDAYTFSGFTVKNNGASPKTLRLFRKVVGTLQGTSNYFCWSACELPDVDTSGGNVTIPPNGVFLDMFLDYTPLGQIGESSVRYIIQNVDNENDTASILVRFNATPTSMNEITAVPKLNALYPNPAKNNVSVSYALQQGQASLEVKNVLGQILRVTPIVAGSKSTNLNVADLPSGIYFVSLKSNGNIIDTKRLVVN
jgi:hypothetical protein